MKKIIKARIGRCYNIDTEEMEYQLQFKAEGESRFNGFSADTFTEQGAKAALQLHNNGSLPYTPYAEKGKYFFCKTCV
ncbi:hypothetical protein [Bacteroides sp.]|uniref:hypothetical protein n=1 Tax=Bacteroides sp. TaxID=29523 RepID=UPI002613987E|nr:hypothetical protein [Bacteroides sp.]MDD3041006.1 hypothetical protein [Bacteroides sp.]